MEISHLSLSEIPAGKKARIHRLLSKPDVSHRLRELGFLENAVVRCVVNGEGNLIFEVCNTRIGLNHSVAQTIKVSRFE
ncbi:MAG: ferrous iron transport protein A [Bacteroidota bacterium]|nr:ferrous iron transport protein A [Bacteroidota bacterium]